MDLLIIAKSAIQQIADLTYIRQINLIKMSNRNLASKIWRHQFSWWIIQQYFCLIVFLLNLFVYNSVIIEIVNCNKYYQIQLQHHVITSDRTKWLITSEWSEVFINKQTFNSINNNKNLKKIELSIRNATSKLLRMDEQSEWCSYQSVYQCIHIHITRKRYTIQIIKIVLYYRLSNFNWWFFDYSFC